MKKETRFTDQIFEKFVSTAHVEGPPPISTPCLRPFVYKNSMFRTLGMYNLFRNQGLQNLTFVFVAKPNETESLSLLCVSTVQISGRIVCSQPSEPQAVPQHGQARLIWKAATLFTLLFDLMCSFRFDKVSKLFIYGFNKEKRLEINALRRLKMLFQRSYSSKSSGGASPRTP